MKKAYGNDDVAILAHFVNYGMAEGRQASVAFDITSYRNAYPELRNKHGKNLKAYYMHYIDCGKSEGRKATGVTELVGSVTILNDIDYSAVYDYAYYITKYPDLSYYKGDDIAVLQHFVDHGMAEGRQASTAFDIVSYRNAYSDLRNGYGKNLKAYYMHYINYGKSEGRQATGVTKLIGTTKLNGVDYSSVYDYTYYLTKHADLAGFGENDVAVLQHFVDHGMSEGRQANTAFDVAFYYNSYPELRKEYGKNLKLYYMHYINYGKSEGLKATGVTELIGTTKLNGVDYSSVYDYAYYINKYQDMKKAYGNDDVAILTHFVNYGMAEGRQASVAFDITSYRNAYLELRNKYGKNLKAYYMHYVDCGKSEGRKATGVTELIGSVTVLNGIDYSLVYDYTYCITKYPDLSGYKGDDIGLLELFVDHGMAEGRQENTAFDVKSYKNAYVDLREAYGNNLNLYYMHYINYGKSESRKTNGVTELLGRVKKLNGADYSAVYDFDYYLKNNVDLSIFANDDIALLQHFVDHGMAEGRQGNAEFNVLIYRGNYAELQESYGKVYELYYKDYINTGKASGKTGIKQIHNFTNPVIVNGKKIYTCSITGETYEISFKWGIDVHDGKGLIDWAVVKASGVQFAIIRIGYGDDREDQDDEKAVYNMEQCENYGIPYGVYLYSYALTAQEVNSEVAHTLRMITGHNPTLGVFFDMEDANGYKTRHGLAPENNGALLTSFCRIFYDAISAQGYKAGVYASTSWFNNIIDRNQFACRWVAHWGITDTPDRAAQMWQYSSDGTVAGISGRVDMDIWQ